MRITPRISQLFICLIVLVLAGCTPQEPIYNAKSYVFGTLVEIKIYGESELEAGNISTQILRNFQEIHNRLHAWKPSPLSGLNHALVSHKTGITIKPDLAEMLQNVTDYSVTSDGLFNPAIGVLVEMWGFQNDEFKPVKVKPEEIDYIVKLNPQMTDLVIENNQIITKNPAVQIDLGGYAKGYALDNAIKFLKKHGIQNALINIGGNIIAIGKHGDKPWRVGIQHPRKPEAIATLDLESGWAIGTSGDYQRYFKLDGKRYCHIIDPRTGYPAQGMQSVTVLVPPREDAGALSDVASKPVFIDGITNGMRYARKMGIENVLSIDAGGQIYATAEMKKRLKWTDATDQQHLQTIP